MNAVLGSTLRIFTHGSLVLLISGGIALGVTLALVSPETGLAAGVLGSLFVGALKAVAPVLVFILVMTAVCSHRSGGDTNLRAIIVLYLIGTFLAALTAVIASFLFPVTLTLAVNDASVAPPNGISDVLRTLLMKVVDNPVRALMTGNYIGILAWAVGLGLALRRARTSTKEALSDISQAVSVIVKFVIRLAPFGIFGLVASTVASTGITALLEYAQLLGVLLGAMIFIALVVNPAIVFWTLRSNPYPLVLTCLRESGITAFFTRSSAANIPVNMALAEKLKLHKDTYSVSIPLGATINMAGAAITITVLTLAAVHTLGIKADFASALLLSVVAAVSACGASGVAGGSLLLIPLACALFGISDDVAMQVVAVGFIVGVLQDSAETALNSSTDVLFTAAACGANKGLQTAGSENTKMT